LKLLWFSWNRAGSAEPTPVQLTMRKKNFFFSESANSEGFFDPPPNRGISTYIVIKEWKQQVSVKYNMVIKMYPGRNKLFRQLRDDGIKWSEITGQSKKFMKTGFKKTFWTREEFKNGLFETWPFVSQSINHNKLYNIKIDMFFQKHFLFSETKTKMFCENTSHSAKCFDAGKNFASKSFLPTEFFAKQKVDAKTL